MKAWFIVVALGMFKLWLKAAALIVVPFLDDEGRVSNPVFGANDATDLSYWNIAVRNGAHNSTSKKTPAFRSSGDEDMEAAGFKKRYRESLDGRYVSFRMTWGKARPEGKKEFYIGWTMNDREYMRLTFFQLRPF